MCTFVLWYQKWWMDMPIGHQFSVIFNPLTAVLIGHLKKTKLRLSRHRMSLVLKNSRKHAELHNFLQPRGRCELLAACWTTSCLQSHRSQTWGMTRSSEITNAVIAVWEYARRALTFMLIPRTELPLGDFCACVWYLSLPSPWVTETAFYLVFLLWRNYCTIDKQWAGRAVHVSLQMKK